VSVESRNAKRRWDEGEGSESDELGGRVKQWLLHLHDVHHRFERLVQFQDIGRGDVFLLFRLLSNGCDVSSNASREYVVVVVVLGGGMQERLDVFQNALGSLLFGLGCALLGLFLYRHGFIEGGSKRVRIGEKRR